MQYKKMAGVAGGMLAAALLVCGIPAYAQSASTTITATIQDPTKYTLVIPASTSVTNFGWTTLASNLKVTGTLGVGKYVEVGITSENGFKFVNSENGKSVAYMLKQAESDQSETSKVNFTSSDLGDTGKQLGVFVEQKAWNAVPGGSYSDVLTFEAATKTVSEE